MDGKETTSPKSPTREREMAIVDYLNPVPVAADETDQKYGHISPVGQEKLCKRGIRFDSGEWSLEK